MRVGVVGCGAILPQYLQTFAGLTSVQLVAVADLEPARAEAVTADLRGVRALTVDDLLADDEVDVVLNLTVPAAHAEVSLRAMAAGKHVYTEKPFTSTTEQATQVLDAARAAGVLVGCAPDTVLGTGVQTARKAVDDGLVGAPVFATATMLTPGHERWHPNPDFYYVPGGGPLMDMGPYYVTTLVTLLGPVASVVGAGSRTRGLRTIGTGPREGEQVPVSTDSHVTAVLVHESGVLSTLVMSFDGVATRAPNIEVHGELGSLVLPDPNYFDGDVELCTLAERDAGWQVLPVSAGYRGAGRGYGLADMAVTPAGQQHRANEELGFHVLDVMESVLASTASGASVPMRSTAARPAPVPLGDLA
ncbi:Gfo/Idh/MocA family protein [Aquipuribacter hungaricus]|uniref:Gfo/Idh/MocA family protein n=1 Tax=Aquipuribacter hungaricus TaxID=545624 RepID=A0ABV7WGL9_9MICO